MKEKLMNNILLKILSLLIAFFVWLIVVNADNPIMTKSFVISDVQLLNEAYIDADGKMCMQDDEQQPIRVTIRAERKILDGISTSDIRAVADLQQAVSLDTDPVMVPIVVNVTTNNTRPDKAYEVGTLTSSPEKIKITGPISLINKIDKVNAAIDVTDAVQDVTEETEVTVIDKNGEPFSDSDMSYLNVSKVTVTARLWKVRSDVRISAEYSGTPGDGYVAESVTTTPNVISVAGSSTALAALEEQNNTIWIPADAVDISGKTSDYEEKVNISDYLPEGLKLTADSSEDLFIRVNILPEGSTVCEVPTKNITVENAPDQMQVAFDTAMIEVRVKKTSEDLADLKESDIKASIDLDGKEEGSYELPVEISLPKGYELVDEITTGVEVSRISTAEENS